MRDTFIDISTNQAFNGDPPYIFRFEEGQSINLNYVKKICMVSDSPQITIKTEPNQNIFRILKMDQQVPDLPAIKMNLKMYLDLEGLIAENNEWICEGFPYTTDDPETNPEPLFYVYMFYILGKSEDPGEYTGDIWINDKRYRISADFYAENEVLKENLKNFEAKLPEILQKAIYENNVHEESADNILINRKNKELLMNYMTILGNKGSYESLLNSLNWFEWGDLLKLEELWKRYLSDNLDYDYFADSLNKQLTPEDIQQLTNHVKSTFIGIYCALQKQQFVRGKFVYQDSFGRMNIQSPTSWVDQDASHMYAPEDLYEKYPELRPAVIAPINSIDDEQWDDWDGEGGAEAAEIGTEQLMTPEEFVNYHPGTMTPGSNTPGNWARVENQDGTIEWIEITEGNTGSIPQGATFWDINFNYIYNEEMPNLLNVITLWTGQDLSLKMTILGNLFSSFFTPIHLDLIHSCIEYWSYAYGLKMLYTQSVDQKSWISNIKSFDLIYDSDLKIKPHSLSIGYYNTMFRNFNTENVFGFTLDSESQVSRLDDIDDEAIQYNIDALRYMYGGESCDIRFIGKIYTGSQNNDLSIYKQRLVWYKNGDEYNQDEIPLYIIGRYVLINENYIEITEDNIEDIRESGLDTYWLNRGEIESCVYVESNDEMVYDSIPQYTVGHYYKTDTFYPIDNTNKNNLIFNRADTYSMEKVFNLDFNIGIKSEGSYVLYFEFYDNAGNIYIKKILINVSDSMHNDINVVKLEYANSQLEKLTPSLDFYQYANHDALRDDFTDDDILLQSHFFSAKNKNIGLNHTLIGIVEKDYPFDGDQNYNSEITATKWQNNNGQVDASNVDPGESYEDSIVRWTTDGTENGSRAVWKNRLYQNDPSYWTGKWPSEWGELNENTSIEHDYDPIPDEIVSTGYLSNLVAQLEETFPEYWWSWDKLQISKRNGFQVKIDGDNIKLNDKGFDYKKYPDQYPD